METTITTAKGEVLLRPSRREDAMAYRDLRLDALQRSPAAFGADYARSAARPLGFWEERMAQGALGEQGVTSLALAGDALIGMTSLVRNTLAKTRHSAAIFGVYVSPDWRGVGVGGEAAPGQGPARHEHEEAAALGAVAIVAGGERGGNPLGEALAHIIHVQDAAFDDHHIAAAIEVDGGLRVGGQVATPAGGGAAFEREPVVDPGAPERGRVGLARSGRSAQCRPKSLAPALSGHGRGSRVAAPGCRSAPRSRWGASGAWRGARMTPPSCTSLR